MPLDILVVDDEPKVRESFALAFSMHGFDVVTTPNVESAFEALKALISPCVWCSIHLSTGSQPGLHSL